MRKTHLRLAMISLLACVLSAITLSEAQAAPQSSSDRQPVVLRAPAAPAANSTARHTATVAAAAHAPSISPSVATKHVAPGAGYTCYKGDLCTVVWDPTTGSYKVFFLYVCARYSLSYWEGTGNFYDNQTAGARSYFYGATGNVLRTFTPPQYNVAQNWSPVYSIRNC